MILLGVSPISRVIDGSMVTPVFTISEVPAVICTGELEKISPLILTERHAPMHQLPSVFWIVVGIGTILQIANVLGIVAVKRTLQRWLPQICARHGVWPGVGHPVKRVAEGRGRIWISLVVVGLARQRIGRNPNTIRAKSLGMECHTHGE